MAEEETVILDAMSGSEFEGFFAHLLSKLGYGQVENVQDSQDEGRDILVRSPGGLIVAECKHHPKGSVGRPVLQKLHSAIITSGAIKGMLVTTGQFTKQALGYAKKLSHQGVAIEMIDMALLADMAARANIRLVKGGEGLNVWTYSVPPAEATRGALAAHLRTFMVSYPRPPEALLAKDQRALILHPVYVVTYDIDAVFETAVGVIHVERAQRAFLGLDGKTGELLDPDIVGFVRPEPQIPFLGPPADYVQQLPTFGVDSTSLLAVAKATIIRLHTRIKQYSGANNQTYRKECVPGERQILIRDIRQVYLPLIGLDFHLAQVPYHVEAQHCPSGRFRVILENLRQCAVCRVPIPGPVLLCETCGRATHSGAWLLNNIHGFRCRICQRTTCRFDGSWVRRFLIGRALLCPPCAARARSEGKNPRPIGALPS